MSRPRILLVTREVPSTEFGVTIYKLQIMRELARAHFEILYAVLLPLSGEEKKTAAKLAAEFGGKLLTIFDLVPGSSSNAVPSAFGFVRTGMREAMASPAPNRCRADGIAITVNEEVSHVERQYVEHLLRRFHPDVILLDYVWLCGLLDTEPIRKPLSAVFANDVLSERNKSYLSRGLPPEHPGWTREREGEYLSKAEVLISIQPDDAQLISEMCGGRGVVVVQSGFETRDSGPSLSNGVCLFVGSGTSHNVNGLSWFLNEVWPQVLSHRPQAILNVCGNVCTVVSGEFSQVHFKGKVPDLDAEYAAASLTLAPLLVGSGMKLKVVESLAHGRVCVTTTVGAQGLNDIVGQGIVLEDDAAEMAKAIAHTLANEAERHSMERTALEISEARFSPKAACSQLVETLKARLAER
jgi:hypothetical protein